MKLIVASLTLAAVVAATTLTVSAQAIRVERLLDEPIIRPNMDGTMGSSQ